MLHVWEKDQSQGFNCDPCALGHRRYEAAAVAIIETPTKLLPLCQEHLNELTVLLDARRTHSIQERP